VGALAVALALHVAVAARQVQPGELVVMTIGSQPAAPRIRVRAFGRDLEPFSIGEGEWRVLIGIDLDTAPGTYTVDIEADAARATHELVVLPKQFRTRRLAVDEAFVNPPESVEARIRSDQERLERTWRQATPRRLWDAPFVRPVPGPTNSAFGTRSVFNGQARTPHGGADFLSPAGTPVVAPNAGRIAIARDLYFSGNTVVIDHGLGLFSLLAHLSKLDVAEGDFVQPGELIGLVGATGRVTGPHLHWAVRVAGARVDPVSVLALLGRP
jgi:murein DD-endopeptidase MepM/ murein hydrolase activator NlpD